MEHTITLHQIRRERDERLAKAGGELLAAVTKKVTPELLRQWLVDSLSPTNRIEIVIHYTPPPTLILKDICATCHESLGFFLATLASPIDFAYNVYIRYTKKENVTLLLISPRRKPWYREFIGFAPTTIMTTDVDYTTREYY